MSFASPQWIVDWGPVAQNIYRKFLDQCVRIMTLSIIHG